MLITIEQKLNRWDSLPETLKEALASEENSHLLLDILKKEHISEEKFQIVALLIGDVIFGFKHPEDLGKELAENLNLAKPLAEALSEQINRKIFALKTILVSAPPMAKHLERFSELGNRMGFELIASDAEQALTEAELLSRLPQFDGWIIGDDPAKHDGRAIDVRERVAMTVRRDSGICSGLEVVIADFAEGGAGGCV